MDAEQRASAVRDSPKVIRPGWIRPRAGGVCLERFRGAGYGAADAGSKGGCSGAGESRAGRGGARSLLGLPASGHLPATLPGRGARASRGRWEGRRRLPHRLARAAGRGGGSGARAREGRKERGAQRQHGPRAPLRGEEAGSEPRAPAALRAEAVSARGAASRCSRASAPVRLLRCLPALPPPAPVPGLAAPGPGGDEERVGPGRIGQGARGTHSGAGP